jgi:hypothetical protein
MNEEKKKKKKKNSNESGNKLALLTMKKKIVWDTTRTHPSHLTRASMHINSTFISK